MNRQQLSSLIAASSLALSFGIAFTASLSNQSRPGFVPPASAQEDFPHVGAPPVTIGAGTRVKFEFPDRSAPSITRGAGSRGDCLETNRELMMAALPDSQIGLTTSPYPTIFVYVPALKASADSLELSVIQKADNPQNSKVYEKSFPIPNKPGIVGLSLESLSEGEPSLPPLQVGQQYHWYVSIVCDPVERSGNAIVDGWVERVEPTAEIANVPESGPSLKKAQLYGGAGIWHETIETMASLRLAGDTAALKANWKDVLTSVGLSEIADADLIDCCQPGEDNSFENEQ